METVLRTLTFESCVVYLDMIVIGLLSREHNVTAVLGNPHKVNLEMC
jgi:hypothetical protein